MGVAGQERTVLQERALNKTGCPSWEKMYLDLSLTLDAKTNSRWTEDLYVQGELIKCQKTLEYLYDLGVVVS